MGRRVQLRYQVDWSRFADGDRWELTPGVDHHQPPRQALHTARMWALKRGMRVAAELPPVDAPFHTPWVLWFVDREVPASG